MFKGHSKERQNALTRVFGGYPIVDAAEDMLIVVTGDDGRSATPGDPRNCLFARACKRALLSQNVVFLRTVAYIDVPCLKEERALYGADRKVLRFAIPPRSRSLIEALDADGEVEVGTFRLTAPTESERLDRQRRPSRGPGGHAKKNNRNVDSLTLSGVRNGSGQYRVFAKTSA